MATRESIRSLVLRETRHVSREHASQRTLLSDGNSRGGPKLRPLLLVDVDGVISLFGYDHATPPAGRYQLVDGITHFLSATAGEHLRRLAEEFELVWCTGWEEKANEYLPHLLGLPKLPHLSFEGRVGRTNAHWKLDSIEAYAGDRPFAWIDDAFNEACHTWAGARAEPTLLVQTMPAEGLTQREAAILERWAWELGRLEQAPETERAFEQAPRTERAFETESALGTGQAKPA